MIEERRLHNWGRWLRRGFSPAVANSIEGEYKIPRDPHALTESRPQEPDQWDAWDIELACRILPIKRHVLLKFLYVWRLPGPAIIRAFRVEFGERLTTQSLDAAEAMSLVLLQDALGLPAVIRMNRAQAAARKILNLYPMQESDKVEAACQTMTIG